MSLWLKQTVEARWFHHAIVGVILLAGVLAGLETSPLLKQEYGPALRAGSRGFRVRTLPIQ